MQAFVSNLTAAVLFIHTVFGCCWHHAQCGAANLSSVRSSAANCCHHHEHDQGRQPHEHPGKCQVECEGSCHYIAPQKLQIDAPHWVASLDFVTSSPCLPVGIPAPAHHQGRYDFLYGAAPPLRTHLLHQVLLI